MRYFDSVASGATFDDAAAMLGTSQSALSQGLARLEQMVGIRLLERDGRRRRLTPGGEIVHRYIHHVLATTEQLAATLDEYRSGSVGPLRVGMIDAAALYLFHEAIASFRDSNPDIVLSISVDNSTVLEQRLLGFQDDIAIVVAPTHHSVERPLLTELLHVYGTSKDPTRGSWALYPSGSKTRDATDAGLAAAGIQPEVTLESSNPAVLRELAELTSCWTVLPESMVAQSSRLKVVIAGVAQRRVVAAIRDPDSLSPAAQSFLDTIA